MNNLSIKWNMKCWTEFLIHSVQHIFLNRNLIVPRIFLFSLSAIFCSCSAHNTSKVPLSVRKLKNLTVIPANVQPENTIRIKRDTSYGSTQNMVISIIGSIAVDDSGRVYFTANRQNDINIFEPDGQYLGHLGRKGRGPGEFEINPALYIMSNRLYAVDLRAYRINVFSLDSLRLIHTININLTKQDKIKALSDYKIHQLFPENDGKFLACFGIFIRKQPTQAGIKIDTLFQRYYPLDNEGRLIPKQILKIKDSPVVTEFFLGQVWAASNLKFLHRPLVIVSDNGSIYSANSEDFLIKKYNSAGQYLIAFFDPYKKVPLTREAAIKNQTTISSQFTSTVSQTELQYMINAYKRTINQIDLPKTWPALNDIKTDDQNRLWVSTIVKNMKVYQWWVLTQKGKLLARFNWPRSKPIKVIKNGYMYTQETDTVTGISKIVRYKIMMKTKGNNNP